MKRNLEREALLLEKWKEGMSARDGARETGVPEGTAHYYWTKFSKNPERYHRLARMLKPSQNLTMDDIMVQRAEAIAAEETKKKFDSLINEGKYADAKDYIDAIQTHNRYRKQQLANVNSAAALYRSAPISFRDLIPKYVSEMLQAEIDKGTNFLVAASGLELSTAAASAEMPPGHALEMIDLIEKLKQEFLAGHLKPGERGLKSTEATNRSSFELALQDDERKKAYNTLNELKKQLGIAPFV